MHGDVALGDEPFVMLDIFYPVREDFIEKLHAQHQARACPKENAAPTNFRDG